MTLAKPMFNRSSTALGEIWWFCSVNSSTSAHSNHMLEQQAFQNAAVCSGPNSATIPHSPHLRPQYLHKQKQQSPLHSDGTPSFMYQNSVTARCLMHFDMADITPSNQKQHNPNVYQSVPQVKLKCKRQTIWDMWCFKVTPLVWDPLAEALLSEWLL